MAQTIALQRGTTTVTTDGSSAATLFTQSGGIATRVMVNALGVYFNTEPSTGGVYIALFHQQSGGQGTLLGIIQTNNYNRSYQFVPGVQPASEFAGGWNTSTASFQPVVPVIRGHSATGIGALNAASVSLNFQGGSNTQTNILAKNFYMGPGDSVFMKVYGRYQSGKSYPTTTANISYSFTTITES